MHDSSEHGGAFDGVEDPLIAADIIRFYERGGEATRLSESPQGRLEFLRTQDIIQRYIKPAPATVIDVGGGPGAYALWLAKLGYRVHLADPLDFHIKQATEASANQPDAPLANIIRSDARNLKEIPNGVADAVLLLGPMYHITEHDERGFAWHEAYRVLRPGGYVFASSISRFASTLDGIQRGFIEDPAFREIIARDVFEGQHRNPTNNPEYFATAYMHHPSDFRREMAVAGLVHQATMAIEGPAWLMSNMGHYLETPEKTALLLSTLKTIEAEPSLLGASSHVMCVGQRPA